MSALLSNIKSIQIGDLKRHKGLKDRKVKYILCNNKEDNKVKSLKLRVNSTDVRFTLNISDAQLYQDYINKYNVLKSSKGWDNETNSGFIHIYLSRGIDSVLQDSKALLENIYEDFPLDKVHKKYLTDTLNRILKPKQVFWLANLGIKADQNDKLPQVEAKLAKNIRQPY